uniref:Cystatin domain-containing protein n=1 Tax=Poecilia latipinna TaxID=48699 RepID=A0A3B3UDZ8_9TELE
MSVLSMWKIVVPIFATIFAVGQCGIPGGWQNADIQGEDFQNALNYAVAQHNRGNEADMFLHKVVEIVSAQFQVVAGANYKITVKLGRTNCKKGEIYQCTFIVWSCPWLNDIQVTEKQCLNP